MVKFADYGGQEIRLTRERETHIAIRREVALGLRERIAEVLREPDRVVQSATDPEARLYYRWYPATPVGAKHFCVVVANVEGDGFVLTAYFTQRVKRGEAIWSRESKS
jgi:hypothetical protein